MKTLYVLNILWRELHLYETSALLKTVAWYNEDIKTITDHLEMSHIPNTHSHCKSKHTVVKAYLYNNCYIITMNIYKYTSPAFPSKLRIQSIIIRWCFSTTTTCLYLSLLNCNYVNLQLLNRGWVDKEKCIINILKWGDWIKEA